MSGVKICYDLMISRLSTAGETGDWVTGYSGIGGELRLGELGLGTWGELGAARASGVPAIG